MYGEKENIRLYKFNVMECLQKNMSELAVWLFGIREQCPDLSESARIGVVVMFSTLFLIVLTFVVVLKRRMAIIEVCFFS